VTSNQKHIRIKLFGIRFLKFPYSL
jgi:hypothetical protein